MEYLILIFEFFYTREKRNYFSLLVIPTIVALIIYYCSGNENLSKNIYDYNSNLLTVLGILLGFTISVTTLLLAIDNDNIKAAKLVQSEKILYKKTVSLYDTILYALSYLIIIQGFLLIANFIYPILISLNSHLGKILFSINIGFIIHVILLLMRSILDFYFIITAKKNKK